MAKNNDAKLSADIEAVLEEAEKAKEFDNKTVPAQAAPEAEVVEEQNGDKVEGAEGETEKKTFKDRLKPLAQKIKDNRKGVILTLAVVGAATVAVAKFAAKTVVEEAVDAQKLSEMSEEELSETNGIENPAEVLIES